MGPQPMGQILKHLCILCPPFTRLSGCGAREAQWSPPEQVANMTSKYLNSLKNQSLHYCCKILYYEEEGWGG